MVSYVHCLFSVKDRQDEEISHCTKTVFRKTIFLSNRNKNILIINKGLKPATLLKKRLWHR